MMEQETDQAPEPLQEVLQNVELHYAIIQTSQFSAEHLLVLLDNTSKYSYRLCISIFAEHLSVFSQKISR